jgi:hypothetical protein
MKAQGLLNIAVAGTLAAASLGYVATAGAQVQTSKTEQAGTGRQQVTVDRGEVVWTSGNNAMIKMEDGQLKLFQNIPESAHVTVDGKQLNVHQLTPGMKIERTTITTTTPKTIRTTKSVTGTVWNVNPPNSVILTMDDKTNQSFNIPRGQKFNIDGKDTDAFGLRKGMRISATVVSEETQDEVSQQVNRTGTAPPPAPVAPPAPPPQNTAVLIMQRPVPPVASPVPTSGVTPPARELPHTASTTPLIGLLALSLFALAMGTRWLRIKTAGIR